MSAPSTYIAVPMRNLQALHHILSQHRRSVAMGLYALVSVSAFIVAHLLRFELAVPDAYVATLWKSVGLLVVARLLAFRLLNLSMGRWRHVGMHDVVRLVAGSTL
ncbi:MAG: hypothetical protein KJP18_09080 [Gemmatimonadetes bacterium]|nr:hypothetical protein [Gemmatimonadota bacterium]